MITRRRKQFVEENARTLRLYNSPLYYLRRIMNEQFSNAEDEDGIIDIFDGL